MEKSTHGCHTRRRPRPPATHHLQCLFGVCREGSQNNKALTGQSVTSYGESLSTFELSECTCCVDISLEDSPHTARVRAGTLASKSCDVAEPKGPCCDDAKFDSCTFITIRLIHKVARLQVVKSFIFRAAGCSKAQQVCAMMDVAVMAVMLALGGPCTKVTYTSKVEVDPEPVLSYIGGSSAFGQVRSLVQH
jgi:hypothetical protein